MCCCPCPPSWGPSVSDLRCPTPPPLCFLARAVPRPSLSPLPAPGRRVPAASPPYPRRIPTDSPDPTPAPPCPAVPGRAPPGGGRWAQGGAWRAAWRRKRGRCISACPSARGDHRRHRRQSRSLRVWSRRASGGGSGRGHGPWSGASARRPPRPGAGRAQPRRARGR